MRALILITRISLILTVTFFTVSGALSPRVAAAAGGVMAGSGNRS